MHKRKGFTPLEAKISTRGSKKFLTGFTLIELLVVIAIIALLMAILMPALARVKNQAKAAACQQKLKQWGAVFAMYANDHDGYFSEGSIWTITTWGYWGDDWDFALCPSATKINPISGPSLNPQCGSTFTAWAFLEPDPYGHHGVHSSFCPEDKSIWGSYGQNHWVLNIPFGGQFVGRPTDGKVWRTVNVKGANNIPLFLDCLWPGSCPDDETGCAPPPVPDFWVVSVADDIQRFCLNRHNGAVNCLFLDFTVRRVPLKCLWKLKWHRKYNVNVDTPNWKSEAPWMKSLPECD